MANKLHVKFESQEECNAVNAVSAYLKMRPSKFMRAAIIQAINQVSARVEKETHDRNTAAAEHKPNDTSKADGTDINSTSLSDTKDTVDNSESHASGPQSN